MFFLSATPVTKEQIMEIKTTDTSLALMNGRQLTVVEVKDNMITITLHYMDKISFTAPVEDVSVENAFSGKNLRFSIYNFQTGETAFLYMDRNDVKARHDARVWFADKFGDRAYGPRV